MSEVSTRLLTPAEFAPFLRGALHAERKAEYLEPVRLPAWALAQSPDPALTLMARMTAGIRLAFRTDSPLVVLDVLETGFQIAGEARRPSVFDLIVDGAFAGRVESSAGPTIVADVTKVPPAVQITPGKPSRVRFDGLPPHDKVVELWLPHTAMVRLRGLEIAGGAKIRAAESARRIWAHYGSSISHGMEADGSSETWPAVAARQAGLELLHLGFGGQCHVDGFAARAIRDSDADLISLKLGINVVNGDTMRERAFKPAVHAFLDTIREMKASTPIVLVSPILCPAAENHPGPTIRQGTQIATVARETALALGALTLTRIRTILEEIVAARRAQGDSNLHYVSGLDLFGAEDLADLPDGLHPNAAGLKRMGERFATRVLSRPELSA